jgi:LysR family transcriptional regulator, low CO2-responsive transcriptional regulator
MSRPPRDIDLHDRVFIANPLVLVAPAGHRLARRRKVASAELRDERFVLRERGSGTRIAVAPTLKR